MAQIRSEAPSSILKITDDLTAFAVDGAVAYRMLEFENERETARMKAFKYAVAEAIGMALFSKPAESDGEAATSDISEVDIL